MRQLFNIIFGAVILMGTSSSTLHDYFVATYDSNLSRDGKSIQISAKFIAHDVEKTLTQLGYPDLKLGSQSEHLKKDSILLEYLNAKLQFEVNNSQISYKIIGSEIELDEDFWVYIEVPLQESIKSLKVYNAVLTETFPSQQNIMHFNFTGNKKSFIFTQLNNEQQIIKE